MENISWARITFLGVGIARTGANGADRAGDPHFVNVACSRARGMLALVGAPPGGEVIATPPCVFLIDNR